MTIKKFQGATEEEARAKAREELGSGCTILSVKEVHPKGLFGFLAKSTYEITAAIDEERATYSAPRPQPQTPSSSHFSAVVDDDSDLRSAFAEVSSILEKTNSIPKQPPRQPNLSENVRQSVANVMAREEAEKLVRSSASISPVSAVKSPIDRAPITERPQVQEAPAPRQAATKAKAFDDEFEPLKKTAPVLHLKEEEKTKAIPQAKPAPRPAATPVEAKEIPQESTKDERYSFQIDPKNQKFVKTLYNQLMDNEVQERYINQVMDDMDKMLNTSKSMENLLSSVYQKMVLKLGKPNPITITSKRPNIVFFIGPTGVGKTTTIAKIASRFKLDAKKNVGFITADTYRMAAADQLRTYADILNIPMEVVYKADEINQKIKMMSRTNDNLDLILIDTIGFSHKNEAQRNEMKQLIEAVDESYEKSVYLVLSATTKYRDLKDITDSYSSYVQYSLIFTKLDETACYGNIYNIKQRTGADLSYVTTGQNVPEDISVINSQALVKQLIGGK